MVTEFLSNTKRIFNLDDIKTYQGTAAEIICERPCWVLSVLLCQGYSGEVTFNLYNGLGITGKMMFPWNLYRKTYTNVIFRRPVFFPDGIYKYTWPAISSTIQYIPLY